MPAKKKSKATPITKKPRKSGNWEKVIASATRALRAKQISSAKKIELLEKRAEAYKALGKLKEYASDIEKVTGLQGAQINESAQAYKQARAEREILSSIAQALVDQADLSRIGQIVGEKVQKFFDAEITGVGFYDKEAGMINAPYYYEKGKLKEVPAFKYGEGVTSYVLKTRKPIYVPTAKQAEKYNVKYSKELPAETMLMAPILSGKKALGTLTIQHSQPNAYDRHQLEILTAIANSMAVAIENARLFDEIQKSNREITEALELETANSEILEVISSSPENLENILNKIVEKAALLSKSDDAAIGLVQGGLLTASAHYGSIPFFKTGEGIPFNRESVAGRAIIDGKTIQSLHNPKDKESDYPLGDKVAKQFGYAMTFATPLMYQGAAGGAIVIRRIEPKLLTEKQISLLQNFANQAAIAIEKARLLNETNRLLEETTQRNAELAVINSVQEGLSRSLKLQEIVELVGEKVGEIFHADTVSVGLYEEERDWGSHIYYVDRGRRVPLPDGPTPRPSLTALVLDTKKPLHIGTLEESEKLGALRRPPSEGEEDLNESILLVPIMAGQKVIGAISVQSYQRNAYSKNDLRLLQTLASSMSVALENARLFDETTQRNAELAVINSVQDALAKELNIQGIYEAVGEKIREIFDAQGVGLNIYDPQTDMLHFPYISEGGERLTAAPIPLKGFSAQVKKIGKSIIINENFEEKAREAGAPIVAGGAPKSCVFVPVQFHGKFGGTLLVENMDRENAFSDSDVRLLETLANSMSVALENARLFDETSQRNAELAVINSVQEAMAKQLDIKGIYDAVGEKIKDIFQAQGVIIGSFDHAAGLVLPHYFSEKGVRYYPDPFPFSGLIKHLIATRETVVINENFDDKVKEFGMTTVAGSENAKSGVFVPLIAGDKIMGAISLQNMDRENAFSDSDVRLLETLANSMSVALENARLFDETAQRNAELAVINSVQEGIAKQADIQGIYEVVGEKIKDIFNAQSLILSSFDHPLSQSIIRYLIEKGERYYPEPSPFTGLMKQLISTRQTVLINENMATEITKLGMIVHPGTEPAKSGIWVPLVASNKTIGLISLQNVDRENAFSDSDVRLLETLANSMSVALENARLFDETNQRNAELAVINSVQEAVARQMDIQGIYEAVGEKFKNIFDAQTMFLATLDSASNLLLPRYMFERGERLFPSSMPPGSFSAEAMSTRKTILINQGISEEMQKRGIEQSEDWGELPKSAIYVPLISRDIPIGIISLQNLDRENAFSDSDVRLLETLANSMSIALENARLFDETQLLFKAEQQRAAELAIINSVQEGLASKLDMQSIYELVGSKISDIFNVREAYIVAFDRRTNRMLVNYNIHEGQTNNPWGTVFPLPRLLIDYFNRTKQPILINQNMRLEAPKYGLYTSDLIAELFDEQGNLREGPEFDKKRADWNPPYKSMLVVPLVVGNEVRGSVGIENHERENAFSDTDVRLLQTLANAMSVALENARLFDETERLLEESRKKEEELSTVNTVGQAVASELELASLIELIGVQVRKIFKADIAYLALYDEEKDLIEFPYLFGDDLPPLKIGEGVVSQVIQGGKPVLINRDAAWKETEEKVSRVGTRSLSYLGVPILVGKRAIGAISVQSTQKTGRFNEADQHLLSTIAANVGAAIENARLFAEVARQKEYFETFFQYSPAAVVVVDFNGTVISWNPAAQTLFGYTAEEAIGRDVDSLVANDPRVEAEARMYTKKFTGELGRVEVKGQRTRKDGSLVDVEVKGLPIAVEGKMVGLLVIYHDISEIEQARRAAEEANQAKSAFLANMSHELRTPLNAIIGFTRIVRRKGGEALPEKQLENLDKVLVSAEHLLGLINTILDIAKIEAGRMELQLSDFNLAALIEGCLATSQPLAKPGVQLRSSLPQNLPQIHSDEEKIRQVILNLLSNAAKFTHEGSITVNGELKGEMISLAVQDTGIGIAPENLSKIFEEFQQADNTTTREYGGTGLGLSISRSLAKLLGGDLAVASVEGQGSTFTLTIPMHLGPVAAVSVDGKEEISAAALEPDKPIILVIDDQPDMFHILQQNLGDAGYQVVGALSGEEGIEKARSLHPFAITLDIMMPRKDGWQVLYELKNDPETKDIPVIILTIVDNKPMGFRLGASDYLVKPLSEKSVLDALERLAKSNGGVHPHKLLVVDDDPKVADLVQQTLEGDDFVIETSRDGAQALSHILLSKPDAILLDLLMPRMDGFQFIEELRKHPSLQNIPIIVLTAKSLSNDEQAELENSVAKIIQKQGLGSETLIKEIHQLFPSAEKA